MPKRLRTDGLGDDKPTKRRSTRKPAYDEAALVRDLLSHKRKIREHLTLATKPGWIGWPVKLGGDDFPKPVSRSQKNEINIIGMTYGCHTCHGIADGPFIADHIPPRNLSPTLVKAYWPSWNGNYRFFPHCNKCSALQSKLVRSIKRASKAGNPLPPLNNAKLQSFIMDQRAALSITGQKGNSKKAQKEAIQKLGMSKGCHSCGNKKSGSRFIADHYPPQEFGTAYMGEAIRLLKLRKPEWQLRPQCSKCSNSQGGTVSSLVTKVRTTMKALGYPVGK
ncbi:MAG: hypothetical protein AAGI13_11970 [Pseudomonadota bacterium]